MPPLTKALGFIAPQLSPLAYAIHDAVTNAYKGNLTGVVEPEPNFVCMINDGYSEITLNLDHYPPDDPNLRPYDMVHAHRSDGSFIGRWKYEKFEAVEQSAKNQWTIHLTPPTAELHECDYEANYTPSPDEDGAPPLGPTPFNVPVQSAVPRTKHCWVRRCDADGGLYDLVFRRRTGRVIDAPNRAVDMGGPDWWWFLDGDCGLTVQAGARRSFTIDNIVDTIFKNPDLDGTTTINCQRVLGGNHNVLQTDPNTGLLYSTPVAYEAFYELMDSGDPYSVPNIGRRVGTVWRDPGVLSQAGADQLAHMLVLRHKDPVVGFLIRLRPGCPIFLPGDQVTFTVEGRGVYSDFWVRQVTEYGSTTVQEIVVCSTIDFKERPFRARGGAAAAALNSTLTTSVPTSLGGGCGGLSLLTFNRIRKMIITLGGSAPYQGNLITQDFVLDSGGSCMPFVFIYGSIQSNIVGGPADADLHGYIMTGGTDVVDSEPVTFKTDGKWYPFCIAMPVYGPQNDATYTAGLYIAGLDVNEVAVTAMQLIFLMS